MKLPSGLSPCVIVTDKDFYDCMLSDGLRQMQCLGDHDIPARLVLSAWFMRGNTEPYPHGTIAETLACRHDQSPPSVC